MENDKILDINDFIKLDFYKFEIMRKTLLKTGISDNILRYINNFNFNLTDLILYDIRNYNDGRESFKIRLDFYQKHIQFLNKIQLNEILINSIENNVSNDFIEKLIYFGANENIKNIKIKKNLSYNKNFPKNFFRKKTSLSCSRDKVLINFLLKELEHPEKKLSSVIHVTGSNGKGSVSNFIRYILENNGYKVNCYTNPSVLRHNESYIISNKEISDENYDNLMYKIKEAYDNLKDKEEYKNAVIEANNYDLSINRDVVNDDYDGVLIWSFSIVAMILAFSQSDADYSIIEVRNGGLRDLTNVFSENETIATVLTYIQYGIGSNDGTMGIFENGKMTYSNKATTFHKAMLGKKNIPMIIANQTDDVLEEIRNIAKKNETYTVEYGRDWFIEKDEENSFIFNNLNKKIKINKSKTLFEDFQTKNIATALATLYKLNIKLKDELVQKGIDNTNINGRLQKVFSGDYVDYFGEDLEIITGFIKYNDCGVQDVIDIINSNDKYNYIIYTSNSKKILKKDIIFFNQLNKLDKSKFKLLVYCSNKKDIFDYIVEQLKNYKFNYELKLNLSSCITYVKNLIKNNCENKLLILNDSMLSFDKNIVYLNGKDC